jgi:hypothetical protein
MAVVPPKVTSNRWVLLFHGYRLTVMFCKPGAAVVGLHAIAYFEAAANSTHLRV